MNKKFVEAFNSIIAESNFYSLWRGDKFNNTYNIFDFIDSEYKDNEEILKLNELNRKIYMLSTFDLNEEQKNEVYELIQNNEIAQNRLIQIIDNNLENNYDFDSLMKYLNKKERKNLINI